MLERYVIEFVNGICSTEYVSSIIPNLFKDRMLSTIIYILILHCMAMSRVLRPTTSIQDLHNNNI